jgi:hypothetical protein
VLEHVNPPAIDAFRNLAALLKPTGALILTVPYSLEASAIERYPGVVSHTVAELDGRALVVGRMTDGATQVFDGPIFHMGVSGPSLEMREFNETELRELLADAGFADVRICADAYAPFGVAPAESWSLPIVARKGPPALRLETTRELIEQWRALHQRFDKEMRTFRRSFWFRVGRKLRLF